MSAYILWVGGIDDHYQTLEEAQQAQQEWVDKGYEQIIIEETES
jgi:hypothetical protein